MSTAEEIGSTLCRITNPQVRARVIYDGIKNQRPIHIPPGATSEPVALSHLTIARLRKNELRIPSDPDLHVEEIGDPDEEAKPPWGAEPSPAASPPPTVEQTIQAAVRKPRAPQA